MADRVISAKASCIGSDGYLDTFEHWVDAPIIPSIPIVRHVHAVFLEPPRIEQACRSHALPFDAYDQREWDGNLAPGWFELSREIRVALGPTTSAREVGLMFESRAHVRLRFADEALEFDELLPNFTLKPRDDQWAHVPCATFQGRRDGEWCRVATLEPFDAAEGRTFGGAGDPFTWPINPLNTQSPSVEHWYFSWSPVNEALLAHWFDRPAGTNEVVSVQYESSSGGEPVWYASGSIAHQIERYLANGGLENALTEKVERVKTSFAEREQEWCAEAQATHATRLARWRAIVGPSED